MIWILACVQVQVETGNTSVGGLLGTAGIYLPYGSVAVSPSTDDTARFSWTSRYDLDPPLVDIQAENGVLTAQVDCLGNTVCLVDMVASIPPDLDLHSDLLEGNISVTGIAGDVTVSTAKGDLSFDGVGGNVVSSVETGNISGQNLTCLGFHGGGITGDRDLHFATVPLSVELNAVTGNLNLEVPSGPYTVNTQVGTGTVSVTGLEEDPTNTYTISAITQTGNITITGY